MTPHNPFGLSTRTEQTRSDSVPHHPTDDPPRCPAWGCDIWRQGLWVQSELGSRPLAVVPGTSRASVIEQRSRIWDSPVLEHSRLKTSQVEVAPQGAW